MLKKNDVVLYEALMDKGLVSKEALEPFIKEVETTQSNLGQILIKRGIFPERDILMLLAEKLKMPFLTLRDTPIDRKVIDRIPVKIATYYRFIPIAIKDKTMTAAVSWPMDIKIQDEIRTQLGYDIEIALACEDEILEAMKKNYGFAADTLGRITSGASTGKTPPASARETSQGKVEDIEKLTELAEDASIIKLVNQIILEAYKKRATDIHIEPFRQEVSLRYRIDGILYDANVPPEIKNFINAIISRIKIMSNLNIVEHRLPQDGRAVVKVQDQVLDLRISTMPTPYGESVVIRILPTQMLFSLAKLGLAKPDMVLFEKLIQKPHGIIFVTGPTGSGKTTTLYTCLSRINTKERKIITIEDPIEYEMSGVIQIQVMSEIGLDFARGLRSILRHDPDVIMVGEVRDRETADIAIRVALTGHLVFSTLHTNDAASGITRLVDIGVEPYLVASSVEAFIAQRLIRLICPDCKHEDKAVPPELKESIARELNIKASEVKVFRGKGCANCNHTGFWGRTAIYEILLVDDTIKDMIFKKASASQIKKLSISRGMRTLRQDGWNKVIAGMTTPEEVINVTSAEDEAGSSGRGTMASSPILPDVAGQASTESDRRIYRRLDNKINVRYKVFKGQDISGKKGAAAEQLSVTKNISAGGSLFTSDEPLPVGTILEMAVEPHDGKGPVECLARVVRVEELRGGKSFEIAVCFLDMTSAQKARLDNYISNEL
ncbi:MAG: ATPase, T2SS/T4P/T4SS family [Candidatus Omnitrophota bacterium]